MGNNRIAPDLGMPPRSGTQECDVTCAFLHVRLPRGKDVNLHMPCGFTQYGKKDGVTVIKLKRTLYGPKQSPRAFSKYMVTKLVTCGLKQSELDPCLFIDDTVIAAMHVDDILMWSTDEDYIYHLSSLLCAEGVELEDDDDDAAAAGFLGVKLTKCDSSQMSMTQEG